MGIKVKISHVPGHVDLMPNEIADRKAKEATEEAKTMKNKEIDLNLIKKVIRQVTTKKWEKYWYNTSSHTARYQNIKRINRSSFKAVGGKKCTADWIRIVTGHNRLGDNMYKMNLRDSPDCECKEDRETAEHVIMNCKKYVKEREKLVNNIERIYMQHNIRQDRRGLNLNSIIYPEFGGTAAYHIRRAVLDFIREAKIIL